MRNIDEIKSDIQAKQDELHKLETELSQARKNRDNAERAKLLQTYGGKWIRVYGKDWSKLGRSINIYDITIAKIIDIETTCTDGEIIGKATQFHFKFYDTNYDLAVPNINGSVAAYYNESFRFYPDDAVSIITDEDAKRLLSEYRTKIAGIVDIDEAFNS